MTIDELRSLPTVVPIAVAAQALGMSPWTAYQMRGAGTFPVRILEVGRKLLCSSIELRVYLGDPAVAPPNMDEAAPDSAAHVTTLANHQSARNGGRGGS